MFNALYCDAALKPENKIQHAFFAIFYDSFNATSKTFKLRLNAAFNIEILINSPVFIDFKNIY